MKNSFDISREVINGHPRGVRLLFDRYGIDAEPTPYTVQLAYANFGDEFLRDFYKLANSKGRNYTGTPDLTGLINQQTDPVLVTQPIDGGSSSGSGSSWWDSFQNIFTQGTNLLVQGSAAYDKISGNLQNQSNQQAYNDTMLQNQMYIEQMKAAQAAKTQQLIVLGLGVVVVLFVIVYLLKHSK